jgi:1,5-anhydro-D-fructose reductase (1,5-anhydro-D-mannitol-forming)
MEAVRWGMIGCGDVAEVKSGPALQKAEGSALVAVMRRDRVKADDYARRHGVVRVHTSADHLIGDSDVDAVYIATPPSSHCELSLKVAASGKPCLVEKPMAMNHAECLQMVDAFRRAQAPLWVAYYRRALPRFLKVRELLRAQVIGPLTSIHVKVTDPLATGGTARAWRFNPGIAGAGLFLDLASHYFDIIDFLVGPITAAAGFALNTGGAYAAEDVTAAAFQIGGKVAGTGVWNFNAPVSADSIVFTGSQGEIATAVRADEDVVVSRGGQQSLYRFRNPPHVHQPLIQTIVDELRGKGKCESTGESGARSAWVTDTCVASYYRSSEERKNEKRITSRVQN